MAFVIPSIFTAVDRMTRPLRGMGNELERLQRQQERVNRLEKTRAAAGRLMVKGAVLAAPFILAGKAAMDFEDRMADVSKTTGLVGKDLEAVGAGLLRMSKGTRTSIEGLQEIANIGGQFGIQGTNNILSFVDAVDKFNVALGGDFGGGTEEAARAIGGLNKLFKETRSLRIDESITRAGSAINALSSRGVQVPELTEFISRVGQLPDAIKPSIQSTAALGAVLNKSGITAEIGARAIGDILLTASQNLPAFASHLKTTEKELRAMINTDPSAFLARFGKSLNGLDATKFAALSKNLKLADSGSIKVIGSLGSSIEMLTEFQALANGEFQKGTSIINEFNTKNGTTAARLQKAKNAVMAQAIAIGEKLLPVIARVLDFVGPLITGLTNWASENKPLAITIGILTAAIWLMNTALLANPIVWIIMGIAALVVAVVTLYKKFEWFRDLVQGLWSVLKILLAPFLMMLQLSWELAKVVWDHLKPALLSIWRVIKSLGPVFETLGKVIGGVKDFFVGLFDSIKDNEAFKIFTGTVETLIKGPLKLLTATLDGIVWLMDKISGKAAVDAAGKLGASIGGAGVDQAMSGLYQRGMIPAPEVKNIPGVGAQHWNGAAAAALPATKDRLEVALTMPAGMQGSVTKNTGSVSVRTPSTTIGPQSYQTQPRQ